MSEYSYRIRATQFYGDKELDTITMRDRKGTLAEELYNATREKFWNAVKACCGCAFENTNEWEMPCSKCKRICKDYYRDKEGQ